MAPAFYGFMGALFLYFDQPDSAGKPGMGTYMGLGFLAFAVFCLIANLRAYGASGRDGRAP